MGWARTVVGGVVLGVLVAGALALGLVAALGVLPGWIADQASVLVRGAGFPEAAVSIERIGLDGLAGRLWLDGARTGVGPGEGIEQVRVEYSPAGLWAGRVERVTLTGARLGLRLGPEGVELSGHRPTEGASPGPPALPAGLSLPLTELVLEDTVLALATPIGAVTVPLSGRLRQPESGRFEGRLELRLAPDGPRASVDVQARAGSVGLSAELDVRAELAGVVPLAGQSYALAGDARLRARVRQDAAGLGGGAELRVAGASLTGPAFAASEVSALIQATSLNPLVTPPGQWVSVGLLDLGLPLRESLVSFQIVRGGRLAIERVELRWAGGRLRVLPVTLTLGERRQALTVEAVGIGLDEVLALFEVEGLEASGSLDGRIPLVLAAEEVRVEGGRLLAAGSGRIRYDPAEPPAFLGAGGDGGTVVLREALRNFHYDELALTIDGVVGQDSVVSLKIKGYNPDFQGGRPVSLNVRLSGALDRILQSGMRSYRIPDSVREQIQQLGNPKP